MLGGRYALARELGRGGMATVYLADDVRHERQVAVKVLRAEWSATLGADRFAREIRVLAQLQHPHVLPLYDSGAADGSLYFVMPFVDGESLRARLDRVAALAFEETTRMVRQIADALDYAHARGVVHRDVKPENILLAGGQALLADFGIARGAAASATDGHTLTSVGTTLGTPAYMSPEQATADQSIDHRTDVYSLGCVAYEALAGAPPFRARNAAALMALHVFSPPPPLVGSRAPLPDAVVRATARALAKDPDERFARAGDFAAALEEALVAMRAPSPAELHLRSVAERQAARWRVLVLEFANVAAAPDADWLSTGIAETLSADLGQIAGLKVVGRDPAARRRAAADGEGRPVDAAQAVALARSVSAHWVVWGAFQKLGARIRITTHLARAEDGAPVLEEKLDGVMDEIFELQDRIVAGLSAALGVEPTTAELARIRRPETTGLTAYEHYAKGYRAFYRFGTDSVRTAVEHFRAAVALDPGYALAHAGLGIVHGPLYIATGRRETLDEGAALLERAIALDPSIGEAHAWLSYMQARQGRFDDAERTARGGIAREPESFISWYMLGITHLGRAVSVPQPSAMARAVPPLLRCIAINPTYHPAHMVLGMSYLLRGAQGHAATVLDRAVEIERGGVGFQFVGSLAQRAVLHLGAGELGEAAPLLDQAIERYTGTDHVYAETVTAYAHWARGCLAERTGALDHALADFGRACEIADAHPHRISIGAHWVKARFGLARVLHRLGRPDDARQRLAEGHDLVASRARFVWAWLSGSTDADMTYELSSTLATLGDADAALDALARAVDAGWSDVPWLRHDPAFAVLRDDADVRRVCAAGLSRVTLPPPVGSGGLA
ncbi:protein kinase domain-containing protein [Roseisolibacter agri]|uniref:non-specific serine/threonine protein kinase n=1 Tax=Roseisolibacter agri TaxID=2014610 RepID=A0AA37VA76_9BACT|nr:serine/threonine-protein kinase [Roseisolibacter agri]GLC25153.1 serine/threonine protein kinase [Roseisolibacter agri]